VADIRLTAAATLLPKLSRRTKDRGEHGPHAAQQIVVP
jgi:hypothetical protein